MTTTPINRACPNGEAANLLASAASKMMAAIQDAEQAATLLTQSSDPQVVTLGEILIDSIASMPISAAALQVTGERLAEHR